MRRRYSEDVNIMISDYPQLRYPAPSGKHKGGMRLIIRKRQAPRACLSLPVFSEHLDVLVVGDNKLNQGVAATLLDDLGCHCEFASTGLEALGLTLRKNFDVILMDDVTPRLCAGLPQPGVDTRIDGLAAARRDSSISMTVMSMRDDVQPFLEAGMDGPLLKPVEGEGLRRIIQNAQHHLQRHA
jgi:two-component system sensor histidine kinase/response regulator